MTHSELEAQMSALEFSLQIMPEKVKGPGLMKALTMAESIRRSGHRDLAERAEAFILGVAGPDGLARLKGSGSSSSEPTRKPTETAMADRALATEDRLPLVSALKHLHIRFRQDLLTSPTEFSRFASLMQGEREIAPANDSDVNSLVQERATASLPDGTELKMLQMSLPGWPEAGLFAVAGITAFGAKNLNQAKACASHALSLNRDSRLARQLVKLLLAKTDLRCPFGVDAANAPDVPTILANEGKAELKGRDEPSHPTGKSWFYSLDGKTGHGPIGTAQLKELIRIGRLTRASKISTDGKTWYAAANLRGATWPQQAVVAPVENSAGPSARIAPSTLTNQAVPDHDESPPEESQIETIEIALGSGKQQDCPRCRRTTRHERAIVTWSDGRRETMWQCQRCQDIH